MIPQANGNQDTKIDEDDIPFTISNQKNLKWYDRVLLNRPLRITFLLLLATIAAPLLIYIFVFVPTIELPPPDGLSLGSCLIAREARLPCGLEAVPAMQCHQQCCYDHQRDLSYHRYPSRFSYLFRGEWTEETKLYPRMLTLPYAKAESYRDIKLSVDEITATHLAFTFYHSNDITGRRLEEKNYQYSVTEHNRAHPEITELNIIVNSTQGNLFNTARGPLIAADNLREISFKLTNETMYGLGEIPLKPDTVKVLYNHKGGLTSVPLIFAKLNGTYHGLLIESLAPTEVIVRGDNQLVLRSITTLGLKFHLFVGPKPRNVMKDVMAVIGAKKNLE